MVNVTKESWKEYLRQLDVENEQQKKLEEHRGLNTQRESDAKGERE